VAEYQGHKTFNSGETIQQSLREPVSEHHDFFSETLGLMTVAEENGVDVE
jgi:hypothetical protein